MIRYYFDIVTNGKVAPDKEGLLLPGPDSARREASLSLAEIVLDELHSRTVSRLAVSVSVRSADGPVCEAVFQSDVRSLH
jgi:hypothetical protein